MLEPIQRRRSRICLAFAITSFFGSPFAWSQQTVRIPVAEAPTTAASPVAVARFAQVPILTSPFEYEAASSNRLELGPSRIAPSERKVSTQSSSQLEVPTILGNTRSVSASLDFLVVSSLSTRKALVSFRGGVVVEPVTRLDLDISSQARQIAMSQFDPNIAAFLVGNDINRPSNSFFGPGIQQQNEIDETEFNVKVNKVWQNGLQSSVGYEPSLAYLFFPQGNGSALNPTHSSDLVTRLEQPLLRGAGRNVNLVNLRVAEWRAQQSLCEIETAVQAQLRSIEQVYWKLHAEYVRLRAIDTVIALAQQALFVVKARYDAERVIYSDVARAQVKLEDLFQQRLSAEQSIREASFNLAQLSGLELESTVLLVPSNTPEFKPPQFEDQMVASSGIATNPELRRQRQAIEIGRQNAFGAQNTLLPQLNLQAAHRTSGLDDDLGSSLKQMTSYQFSDFTLGLQYTQQLGTRLARTQVTTAKLQIAREQALLEALERRIVVDILQELSRLKQTYQRYESALRQVEQSKKWVDIARTRYEDPPVTAVQKESFLVTLVDYQTALQSQIDSIVLVANTLAEYNTALAVIDERRGTLMRKWGIGACSTEQEESVSTFQQQSEVPLPQTSQVQPNMLPPAAMIGSTIPQNTAVSPVQQARASAVAVPAIPPLTSPSTAPAKVYIPPLYGPR